MDSGDVILIVDDTPENLRVLGDMLDQQGYEVRIATSGGHAMENTMASPPDLILLDILMPGMDGYEVCRRLKANPDLRHIPVIFISALAMPEQKTRAFHEGAADFITKPFQSEEVVARVRTHLQVAKLQQLHGELAEHKAEIERLRTRIAELEHL